MGQKIHPLGFRVGITKRHQTVWFARFEKRQYAQSVLEDVFLRKSLQKLLPELLKKEYGTRSESIDQTAKIANIKMERGFIPYEITIQIHAQNCEAVKTAIDKLELNKNSTQNFLKSKYVLEQASVKSQDVLTLIKQELNEKAEELKESSFGEKKNTRRSQYTRLNLKRNGSVDFEIADKRVRKRKTTLERFRRRILENMLIVKKGQKITRKFQKSDAFTRDRRGNDFIRAKRNGQNRGFSSGSSRNSSKQNANNLDNLGTSAWSSILVENREQSQKTTKFMNVFLSKNNKSFLKLLKSEMNYWNSYLDDYKASQIQQFGSLRYAPLGYRSKWSLGSLKKYQQQPVKSLVQLLKLLQKQALQKFELLRREFLVLGTFSKVKSFVYFQRIRFIKALKNVLQRSQFESLSQQKTRNSNRYETFKYKASPENRLENERAILNLREKALTKKLTNLKDENRKTRFVQYLQSLVQKHRQKNLYLYLSTISDARKYLKQIQRFTKEQANFLFGINKKMLGQMNSEQKREFVKLQLKRALQKSNCQTEFQRNLQDVFVRQIQQQKTIAQQNLALLPKISVKFYSVKPEILEISAGVVTEAIVDKLEKREAFRKVIKKVSEDLMKSRKVKGVKIQVSGRLNGAEIARSEWVRAGRVPLQTLRANIDYCYKTAQTIYGIIGVKVWIYKGYTKINKNA